jgi:hypothetical protein
MSSAAYMASSQVDLQNSVFNLNTVQLSASVQMSKCTAQMRMHPLQLQGLHEDTRFGAGNLASCGLC